MGLGSFGGVFLNNQFFLKKQNLHGRNKKIFFFFPAPNISWSEEVGVFFMGFFFIYFLPILGILFRI